MPARAPGVRPSRRMRAAPNPPSSASAAPTHDAEPRRHPHAAVDRRSLVEIVVGQPFQAERPVEGQRPGDDRRDRRAGERRHQSHRRQRERRSCPETARARRDGLACRATRMTRDGSARCRSPKGPRFRPTLRRCCARRASRGSSRRAARGRRTPAARSPRPPSPATTRLRDGRIRHASAITTRNGARNDSSITPRYIDASHCAGHRGAEPQAGRPRAAPPAAATRSRSQAART